jgi:hypothetical protein
VVHVARTSLGYRISTGSRSVRTNTVEHFSISREGLLLSHAGARMFSHLLVRLAPRADVLELIQGNNGVFHLLLVHSVEAGSLG